MPSPTQYAAAASHLCRSGNFEAAAARIQSYILRQRLEAHPSAMWGYQKGGRVAAEINAILAEAFCQDLLAAEVETDEDEKVRCLGDRR